ncbi:endolytic transglycosylase MltG [Uliginosibacterium aquaticum]|uniref:Endolytic murein transglycosylase n=1 Tax=Uliginosibacterium aquaticum TaxID=2731212 RepID=A0ABX2ILY3_9RHOO|nr:endolytic transglycosylase MltG [Uliginosibacterium aquaticum]NSL55045.1 endolytic transglycosylase MltG [Uliginosibacterium aquaticum]
MLRILVRFLKLCVLLSVLLLATGAWFGSQPLTMRSNAVDFEIVRGDSMKQVSRTVADAGINVWPPVLTWLARLSGHSIRIKAGSYRIDKPITAWELVQLMSTGANAYADVTIVEGWSFARLRAVLNAHPELKHDSAQLSDAELMHRLDLAGKTPEGLFAPDTYSFSRGASDFDLLLRARQRMDGVLRDAWEKRAAGLPFKTPYEALILASVVEKETGRAADRALIASVFINRLRIGMPLQSDPTVIYGMGASFDGNLRRRDLQADTPYNSYTRVGLPPTPIALPGQAALQATLNPAPSNYLYFVARGDGSSEFSRTLDEHNRAVARYQRAGRKS